MNPSNGDRSQITIDSSWGGGERVVSGEGTSENIVRDKITLQVVSEHIGDNDAGRVPASADGRVVATRADAERARQSSLTDTELQSVAAMAKHAEKHYQCPQDIK